MRDLTNLEEQWLLDLKHDLMDSDGHDKTNVQAECKSELEANEKIKRPIEGEN